MSKNFRDKRIETQAVHSGEPTPRVQGAVSLPIFQSSTFEYAGGESYHELRYIRLNNTPNHAALHGKLAELENGEAALATASGMAAISTALMTVLSAGDHLLAQGGLYGGTHTLITRDLPKLGISHDLINEDDPGSWLSKLKPNTKAVYVETISNPLMKVADLEAVVRFAKERGLTSMIDTTFASPVNFRPLDLGFDLALHSATKYLNGHTDIVAGVAVGSERLISKITHKLDHFGGSLDPHACFLLQRGLKTLVLRVKHQNQSALRIAQFLESRPAVTHVNYPGLESHPQHARAKRLLSGFGGMLSFELDGPVETADGFIRHLTLPVVAPSLGGVETLITRPAATSHVGMPREERLQMGITDNLIRLSVGIEATEDLIADFQQAFEKLEADKAAGLLV